MSFAHERKKAGFSQSQVAKSVLVDQSTVSRWETGKTRPRAALLTQLAGLYRCTVDELLSGNPVCESDREEHRRQPREDNQ